MATLDAVDRHWRWWVVAAWIAAAAYLVYMRWLPIQWFALGDTDDNLRILQVRAWLAGQDWFDLRQYRLNPPGGADIHWSRVVDLPIAAIKLSLTPLIGGRDAERWAVAIAPLLPMGVTLLALGGAARRLIAPGAFALAVVLALCAHSLRGMWMPLRIDHHGWQLAMMALVLLGLTDRRIARGGVIAGLASALSLSIGLEMLVYLAAAGALITLWWAADRTAAPRLLGYGASLAGGTAAGFLLFASYANRAPVCDALSPVWLSAMLAGGAGAVLLSRLEIDDWRRRLFAAAGLGFVMLAGFALAWPDCLSRPEGVSAELERMWLNNVREARPIYLHSWQTIVNSVALPIAGLVGSALMIWRLRGDRDRLFPWIAVAVLGVLPAALLVWQTRASPAAQLLAVPGATALGWIVIAGATRLGHPLLRVPAIVGAFLLISGLAVQQLPPLFDRPQSRTMAAVGRANGQCPTLAALRPVARQPRGLVLTFVDLGPRLAAVTHHDAIAGPYHRNGDAILSVIKAFRGSAEEARRTVAARRVDYILICPGLSESTVHAAMAPNGFYRQLLRGQVPEWLEPVALPDDSPYRMWRVRR